MIICISFLWIYDLNMESVNWPKYLTTCKSYEFLISKGGCLCQITHYRVHFPLKWEIWINLVSYCVHIVSTSHWILYSVWLFVYLSYEYIIWIWRVLTDQNMLTDQNISPLASCLSHFTAYLYLYTNTITYQVDSDFPFQWEVYPLFCYYADTAALWNEKVTRLASGELLWSVNTLHIQIIYP